MTKKKPGKKVGSRSESVRVKSARGRKVSSTLWLQRQLNDPYVQRAKAEGWRSRAAFKLIELNDKYHLLKPGMKVVDLGAAPGGWSQVAVQITGAGTRRDAAVVGLDLLPVDTIAGAELIVKDFMDDDAPDVLKEMLGGNAQLVMSDMAPNTTGHATTDHLRIMGLCEAAFDYACEVLDEGGAFICKTFQGGAQNELLTTIKQRFASVRHAKPKASRADSSEMYLVATGFKK